MKCIVILVLLLIMGGCGIEDSPPVTQKDVPPNMVVGLWTFESQNAGKTSTGTLELDETGAFTVTGSFGNDGYGNWKLRADHKLVLIYAEQKKVNSSWYIRDDPQGGVTIVGGDGNGVPYDYFKKIR
ncbi:MAG: hypothetical protein U0175_25795 [Caldilineaceae bacterium]